MIKINLRIKMLRERVGITQQKLAELLGVSRPTISQMENGERKISVDELMKLSRIFNVSVNNLLDLEKQPEVVLEEHRKKGGNPDIDVSFQYLRMLFEPDDKKLEKIYKDYKSGKMLTGELKEILINKINAFLKEHQKKRKEAAKKIDQFIYSTQ